MVQKTDGSGKVPEDLISTAHPMKASGKRLRLGELLIQAGLIDTATLNEALSLQKVQKKKIGQVLIDMGIVDDVELAQTLADQLHLKFARLNRPKIQSDVIAKVPVEIAEKYSLIPIEIIKGKLVLAMSNPLEYHAVDDIRFITQMPIYVVVSPLNEILAAIEDYYQKPDIQEDLEYGLDVPDDMEIIQESQPEEKGDQDLMNLSNLPPVVRFTNGVIAEAIRQKASDIHIEPQKSRLLIRCRVDGIMRETMKTDRHVHASLVSRIKVISNLDISIRRKPQDGKAQVNYRDSKYDLRVSTLPTSYGEKVTIRILNPATAKMLPEDLGFSSKDLEKVSNAIATPQGIILVTGPTGSGKSSTLYACLNKLNTPLVNIITVEDPVEFDVDGINQVQINPKAGISFAAGLRSILRQDPDIVMLGEIRDTETAGIAFQAAQTGHLVLSTLHTNDAPSAVTRLLDLKIEDFQLSAALIAVIGQRLVRRIHQECKKPDILSRQILNRIHRAMGEDVVTSFWKGAGCQDCLDSGYTGRMGLYEILTITPSLKEYIVPKVSAQTIKQAAEREGFLTMAKDGIQKALKGLTTIEEVFRVAPPEIEADMEDIDRNIPSASTIAPPDAKAAAPPIEPVIEQRTPAGVAAGRMESPGAGQKILIVDDNEDIIAHLRRILESRNYTVLSADNGIKALELAKAAPPGLVVTDLKMPEMDGISLIRELKSREATRHIPIIMLTVKDELDAEIESIDAGADDYIVKPLDAQRFLARVGRFFVRRKKILVVDDDVDMRRLLQRVLEIDNYLVITAENGKLALPVIEKEKPDLVITDYRMPEMDGIELIRMLKSRETTSRIPIIMVTVKDEVESEVEVIDAGAADYLTKPLSKKRLLIRVKRVLRMID